jgi:5-methylcytosine-specific restriction endonuclease McrA
LFEPATEGEQMKHLSDQQLLQSIENLVRREREILNDVLLHLRELDRRKLFSALGFTSLFDYATKQLKYSPDQAGRRIAAMRVLREVPEAEAKVIDGSLTLSSLAQAHWHFNKVEHTKEEKREVLIKLENATKKQTRAILQQEEKTRFSFEADQATETLIEELRGVHPHLNFDQLVKKVFEVAHQKLHPAKKMERAEARELTSAGKVVSKAGKVVSKVADQPVKKIAPKLDFKLSDTKREQLPTRNRYIPAEVKRSVWKRAQGKCLSCKSTFGLEYDHVRPFAKGGASNFENLQLLCRNCNQRKGVEQLGMKVMSRHFDVKLN